MKLQGAVISALVLAPFVGVESADLPAGKTFTNSLDMKLVRVEAGTFQMGFEGKPLVDEVLREGEKRIKDFMRHGTPDEHPRHAVTISQPYFMGAHEVTNVQYEAFDPAHREQRGANGRSLKDGDAVVLVTWDDAARFCRWLSEKERLPYRLPTEAEWEYGARAGTKTAFSTGDTLPDTNVPANAWGLYAMHGNVEEWCHDWYGAYPSAAQVDPVGRAGGTYKVTRGGAYATQSLYLRSANRGGTIRRDKSWIIGFRVVLGERPDAQPLARETEPYQNDVSQTVPKDIAKAPEGPYFTVRPYVKIPKDQAGPLHYYHNHNPDIVQCPNGDLLAIFFSTQSEGDREMVYGASRLRYGNDEWDDSCLFWGPPDRKAEYGVLWRNGDSIYNFQALGAYRSRPSAVVLRTSDDNCTTWSEPRVIAERDHAQGVMESVIRMAHGTIAIPADGHNLLVSFDDGHTWSSPVRGDLKKHGVAGIHTPIVELANGDIFAFGRNDNIDGRMPISISSDVGQTWKRSPGPFPPVGGGQRATMLRLREGPIFFASFAKEMTMRNGKREQGVCSGLFAALSFDEGQTWPAIQLISDGSGRQVFTRKNNYFALEESRSEKNGYLASTQSADGVIHLVSNRSEYAFNLEWLWPEAAKRTSSGRSD